MKGQCEKRISKSGRVYFYCYKKTGRPHTGRPTSKEKVGYNRNRIDCLERDNYICQLCGATLNLDAHHKDNGGVHISGKEANHNLDNLITLCHRCHLKLHYGVLGKNEQILSRRKNGETLQSIANSYGVSRQRIHQLEQNTMSLNKKT